MDIRFSQDEMRHFKRNGFVIKRNVMPPELIEKAQAVFWERAPAQLRRDDPATWMGPFRPEFEFEGEEEHPDQIGGYRHNLRTIGDDDWIKDMIARNANLIGMAEQLLGKGRLDPPDRTRGIYTTLPRAHDDELSNHLHVDRHVFHLSTVTYLGPVVAGGGGFRVWPASHTWFARTFESRYRGQNPNRYQDLKAFFEDQPSLECTGDAGDVVFWHHRLAHMAGHNTSRNLRQAILYDFRIAGFDYAREEPPQVDIWQDWPGLVDLD